MAIEISLESSKEKIRITNVAFYGLLHNYIESGILESYFYREQGPQYLLVEICAPLYISRDKLPEIEVSAFRQDIFLEEDIYENIGKTWMNSGCVVPSPSIKKIFRTPKSAVKKFIEDEQRNEKWLGIHHLHPTGSPNLSKANLIKDGKKYTPISDGDDLAFYRFQSEILELSSRSLFIIFGDSLNQLKKKSSIDEQTLKEYKIEPYVLSDGSISLVHSAYVSCKRSNGKVIIDESIERLANFARQEKISSLLFGGAITNVEGDEVKISTLSSDNFVVDDNLDEFLVKPDINEIMGGK